MQTSFPMTPFGSGLFLLLNVLFMAGASGATPGADLDASTANMTCKMTTTFPDRSTFAEPCLMTIVAAGENSMAPKGWVQFLDVNKQVQIFSLNFFPPRQIKADIPYTVTTDNRESFLNGIVQPTSAHQLCRMTKKFSSTGIITFTAVGRASADYHGTLQVYPACYVNLGTPQQTLVPSGKVGGGTTLVVF
jgi:hypothetical protein